MENLLNSRAKEVWGTLACVSAVVGLVQITWLMPTYSPLTVPLAIGSCIGAFGQTDSIRNHEASVQKIHLYKAEMGRYMDMVNEEIDATGHITDMFNEAERMLTDEVPFNQY